MYVNVIKNYVEGIIKCRYRLTYMLILLLINLVVIIIIKRNKPGFEWLSDCCLTSTQQLFSYIMARTSFFLVSKKVPLYLNIIPRYEYVSTISSVWPCKINLGSCALFLFLKNCIVFINWYVMNQYLLTCNWKCLTLWLNLSCCMAQRCGDMKI
jgi:hypothetical protein